MRFLRLIFIYRFGLFIALLPGVRPGFDASCLKILFGFPRYSDCRWRFIDRRRSLHLGIRAAALALPCVSCRIIAARGHRSNRPHIGSAGICGCRYRSCLHGASGPPVSKRASKILAEFASCSSRSSRVQAAGRATARE